MTKICCSCKVEKSVSEFYSKGKEGKVQSMCKACFSVYCMKRWTQFKKDAIIYKGGKCVDCDLKFDGENHYLFDFHHLDPTQKESDWNKLRLKSEKKRKDELDKCDCLCAICHRIRHYRENKDV